MYSQGNEESVILQFAPTAGRLLDIGAHDGKTFSNSAALIDRGWSGVLVEPASHAFWALTQRYWDREHLTLVNAAIASECHLEKFWLSADLLSTLDPDHAAKWEGAGLAKFRLTYTPTISMAALLAAFPPPYDFVTLDIEGKSAALFLGGYFCELGAKVICIEHDDAIDKIAAYAAPFGYEQQWFDGTNMILVRR